MTKTFGKMSPEDPKTLGNIRWFLVLRLRPSILEVRAKTVSLIVNDAQLMGGKFLSH